MAKIFQSIEPTASFPSVTWRSDGVLDTPRLTAPADEVRYCPQILLWVGASADIRLTWDSVTGASFYVVQLCENSSFSGPTLRGIRTSNEYVDLNYVENVRQSAQLFWRVAAYDGIGSASKMSAPRSLEISCPELNGVGYDPDETPGTTAQLCDALGVDLQIEGPTNVRLTDTGRIWVVNLGFDCESQLGDLVSIDDMRATVTQSSTSVTVASALQYPSPYDAECPGHYLKLDIAASCPESFDIKFEVDLVLNTLSPQTFTCTKTVKVLVEGSPASGGGNSIRFRIEDSYYCGSCYAQAQVISVPYGVDVSTLPDVTESSPGSGIWHVDVYDKAGCFLDEPPENLVNRIGYAKYMTSLEDGPCPDTFGDFWEIWSLCCDELQCGA